MRSIILATLTASILVSVFLGVSAFVRARAKGRYYSLAALFGSAAVYASAYTAELLQPDLASVFLCIPIEYVGVAGLTISMFFVIRDFKGAESATPGRLWLVAIIPVLSVALAATSLSHEFLYISPRIAHIAGFSILRFTRGPWYYVHLAYAYAVFLYGVIVFTRALRYGTPTRRAQARFMLIGTLVPIAANIIYAIGLSPSSIDLTPIAFTISGAIFSAGIFKYRLLDMHHITRDAVFEHMREAAIVIGDGGTIVDFNKAAASLFPTLSANSGGLTFAALSESRPNLFSALSSGDGRDTIPLAVANGEERRFETRRSRVLDKDGRKLGILLMLHDVTERELLQERLRELASLDELTRIANRRHFYELAGVELERARRHGRAIGFAVMDMNGFKGINDRYGHRAGDDALRLAARLCVDALRSCDIVGRIGGDEFAFVFPECDEAGTLTAVEKIRRVVNAATFSSGEDIVGISASFGYVGSSGPVHPDLEDILSTADKRMYADKPIARTAKAAVARKRTRA